MKSFSFVLSALVMAGTLLVTGIASSQQSPELTTEGESIRVQLIRAREQMGEAAEEFRRLVGAAGITRTRGAMIGIGIEDVEDGVRVLGVSPGGPADESGVSVGDVILSLDGISLVGSGTGSPSQTLTERVRAVQPGDTVQLTLQRGGSEIEMELVAAPRTFFSESRPSRSGGRAESARQGPPSRGANFRGPARDGARWRGMELVKLTPALGAYFDTEQGILVVRAPRNETLELIDGDVILEINGRVPTSTEHAMRIFGSFNAGENLALRIMRNGRQETLEIEFQAPLRRR
ncbi:MAG: PDZ domain-containing protein [Pseudomonadota bacterium]|nr:PDZ domain-containing protein [Pseudomonadota bacterium]